MYKEDRTMFTVQEMDDRYSLPWMQYAIIKAALSKRIVKDTLQVNNMDYESEYDRISNQAKPVKYVYNKLVELENYPMLEVMRKFAKNSLLLSEVEYREAFADIHFVTNVTKYRDFQYRLLVGAIPTNDRLFHWRKKPSQKCDFCECPKQTIGHLLYYCARSRKVWRKMEDFMNTFMFEVNVNSISFKDVMLNKVRDEAGHICNFMILVTKQFIYAKKCQGETFCFDSALRKIDEVCRIEKYNAKLANKLTKHIDKWYPYTGESMQREDIVENCENYAQEYIANLNKNNVTN